MIVCYDAGADATDSDYDGDYDDGDEDVDDYGGCDYCDYDA